MSLETGCIMSGYPMNTAVVWDLFAFKIYPVLHDMYSLGIRGEMFKETQSN